MDSITQVTLGAAVGEVVLGKKVGNRAMLWGAIAGTIPDLDIVANFQSSEISALAFHRAFTHSITFAVVSPILIGWIIYKIYDHEKGFFDRSIWLDFLKLFGALWAMIFLGTIFMPILTGEVFNIGWAVSLAILFFPFVVFLRQKIRFKPSKNGNATWKEWSWLVFWAIFTHPLLDSCTTYGTQLFQPFWDYRVALNNISVADPIYTIPFLLCLIIAFILRRGSKARRAFTWAGIILSSMYMVLTGINKLTINQTYKASFAEQKIEYTRYMTSPTIFNNVLWNGIAESEDSYHYAMRSLLDKSPTIPEFKHIAKNHELLDKFGEDRNINILKWFSDGYYNVEQMEDGKIKFNDLRFGTFGDDEDANFVFSFIIEETPDGLKVSSQRERPDDADQAFGMLWERIKGI
jgi:inner membrane protein